MNGILHTARHGIIPEEVEEVCHSNGLIQQGHAGRLLIIGLTKGNRILTVVIDPELEKWCVLCSYYQIIQ